MTGGPEWHPMAVHFPLALVVTGAIFLLAARLLRQPRHSATLAIVGTWNLCLGAIAALFALGTGLAARSDAPNFYGSARAPLRPRSQCCWSLRFIACATRRDGGRASR